MSGNKKKNIENPISTKIIISPKITPKSSSKVEVPEPEGIKHPLEYAWSFWMNTNITNNKNKWESNLVEMTTFDTVEDYWCLYHHMKRPSELNLGQDYAVFKKGIRPMWEDKANRNGGRWLIVFEKRRSDIDWVWLDVILLMIGENFENSELICGVFVNVRGKCKIAIWTSDATNEEANLSIGRKLREHFGPKFGKYYFQIHDTTKNLYTV